MVRIDIFEPENTLCEWGLHYFQILPWSRRWWGRVHQPFQWQDWPAEENSGGIGEVGDHPLEMWTVIALISHMYTLLAGRKSCWNLATELVWSLLCLLCQQLLEDLWHRWQFCFKILWTIVDSSHDNFSPPLSQNISAGEARITSGQRNALESANKSSYGFFIPQV